MHIAIVAWSKWQHGIRNLSPTSLGGVNLSSAPALLVFMLINTEMLFYPFSFVLA